jgi:hypothetical protein
LTTSSLASLQQREAWVKEAAMTDAAQVSARHWTIRQLFSGRRYLLDHYQREYAWEDTHVGELIVDLTTRFMQSWKPEHEKQEVATYEPYFLGPIVTCPSRDSIVLIDGQQRLTTLMLLLMWLSRKQGDRDDAVDGILPLVRSDHYGTKTFAVEDLKEERRPYLEKLLDGQDIDLTEEGVSVSVRNIVERYAGMDNLFPEDLCDDELPYFVYWLLDRVIVVEISTPNEAAGLSVFETMNDRGLRLAPLDLLKSFLLENVAPAGRPAVDQTWRSTLAKLYDAEKNSPTTFVKNWLRAKYSRGLADDDAIGGTFHKWLRLEHKHLGLQYPGQFHDLVVDQMQKLGQRTVYLIDASKKPTLDLEPLYYNGLNSVTLQFPLILAAIRASDDQETFRRKARLVAGFLDIYIARFLVNSRDFRQDTLSKNMFALARELRDQDLATIAGRLSEELAALPETFEGVVTLGLRSGNRLRIRYLLARLTAWVAAHGDPGAHKNEAEIVRTLRQQEIEHVWADKPAQHPEVQPRRFQTVRNRFGALVLLPKPVNSSIGDDPYVVKLPVYRQHNLLAGSLDAACYQNASMFQRLIDTHRLPFKPYEDFTEVAIGERQKLYQRLCELVWDPQQYGITQSSTRPAHRKASNRARFGVAVARLVEAGYIIPESKLVGTHQNVDYSAQLTPECRIQLLDTGETFDTPSAAAAAALDRSWNGWWFWRAQAPDGTMATLDSIRKRALKDGFCDE